MSDKPKIKILKKAVPREDIPTAKRPKPIPPPAKEVVEPPLAETENKEVTQAPEKETAAQAQNQVSNQETNYDSGSGPVNYKPIIYGVSGFIVFGVLLFLGWMYFFSDDKNPDAIAEVTTEIVEEDPLNLVLNEIKSKGFAVEKDILRGRNSMTGFLSDLKIPGKDVARISNSSSQYGLDRLSKGDKTSVYRDPKNFDRVQFILVDPRRDPYNSYAINFMDDVKIEKIPKKVEIREVYQAAIVENNLASTFNVNKLNFELISHLEDAFKWTIDFFDIKDGDRFKILFEEEYIDGKAHKIDKIKAIYFEKGDEKHYAFYFNKERTKGFFNEFGQSLKKSFLSTPLRYGGVITSGYGSRTHPVTGDVKHHLGTDYAAPQGTPIQSVADGKISIATYKNNNGNYVKIRHDKTYETQYLHMEKFADGIKPGARVKQGQVIGYVGSTGMSTGPHVCFRFWKNEKQVNHLRENLSTGKKIGSRNTTEFNEFQKPQVTKLEEIPYF